MFIKTLCLIYNLFIFMYMDKAKILKNLRFLRKSRKISQKEMASRLQISQVHYSNMERGKSNTTIEFLSSCAEAIGMDLIILMTEK